MGPRRLDIVRNAIRQPGEVELSPQLEATITPDLRRQHFAEKSYGAAMQEFQLAQQKLQAAGLELQKRNERAAAKLEMALELAGLPTEHYDMHFLEDEDRAVITLKAEDGSPLTPAQQAIAELKQRNQPAEPEGQQPTDQAIQEGEEVGGS